MSRDARAEKVAEVLRAHHGCSPDVGRVWRCNGLLCGWSATNGVNVRAEHRAHQAAAVLDALDDDASETTAGRANDCTHGSASGVDTSDGPDKVWACDHCGLRWRQDGAPLNDDAQAKVERCERLANDWSKALSDGCPNCGHYVTDCDHIEGYNYAWSDLHAALNPEPTP